MVVLRIARYHVRGLRGPNVLSLSLSLSLWHAHVGCQTEGKFGSLQLVRHKQDGKAYILKQLSKIQVCESKRQWRIVRTKMLMQEVSSPFILELMGTMQDSDNLYTVTEFLGGGDLFSRLGSASRKLQGRPTRFVAAQLTCALEHVHARNIVFRNMRPENVMIRSDGTVCLMDFKMAKRVRPGDRTFTTCGTPEYMAPEVIHSKGHGAAVDWWALGILIFECLAGTPPFDSGPYSQALVVYKAVNKHCKKVRNAKRNKGSIHGFIPFPMWVSDTVSRDIIAEFLLPDPEKRLGRTDVAKVKAHKFFATVPLISTKKGKRRESTRRKEAIDWGRLAGLDYPGEIPVEMASPFDTSHHPAPPQDIAKDERRWAPTDAKLEQRWLRHFPLGA